MCLIWTAHRLIQLSFRHNKLFHPSSFRWKCEMSKIGHIITFYSFKGGVGRTMALANVAWILSANNYRVLMVDWDLEAPGLHHYFRPFLADPELRERRGLIELFTDYVDYMQMRKEDRPDA